MSVDDSETFQRQALEIIEPDEDFDPNAPIEDGEQYLTHMLHERRQQPRVIVRPFFPTEDKEPKALKSVVPHDEVFELLGYQSEIVASFRKTSGWKHTIEKQFHKAQTMLEKGRQVFNEDNLENIEIPFSNEAKEWIEFFKNHDPKINIMVRFNQRSIEDIIEYLCEWLRARYNKNKKSDESGDESYDTAASKVETKPQEPDEEEGAHCIEHIAEKNKNLEQDYPDLEEKDSWFGQWSYAAFAAIDPRVGPELIGTIREIARLLILFRQRIDPKKETIANSYSLLIHLIVNVFRQLDLGLFV